MRLSHPETGLKIVALFVLGFIVVLAIMLVIAVRTLGT
jgi:hypothetical protein